MVALILWCNKIRAEIVSNMIDKSLDFHSFLTEPDDHISYRDGFMSVTFVTTDRHFLVRVWCQVQNR